MSVYVERRRSRRIETKFKDGKTVYLLIHQELQGWGNPVVSVQAFSTESKILAELKRLAKHVKLTPSQKKDNARAVKEGRLLPHEDPIDCYSIREIQIQ